MEPEQVDVSPRSLRTLMMILILVLFLGAGLSSFIFLQSKRASEDSKTTQVATKVLNGWKLYHNDVLGLEFMYPESWGDPYTDPDYITSLDKMVAERNSGRDSIYGHFIEVRFKNIPYIVYITLFDDVVPGDSRKLNSQIINWGYYEDNIATLRQTGNICDYHISYNHNGWMDVVSEIYNNCNNGIKKSLIERRSDWNQTSLKDVGIDYSYFLNYYAYVKAGNTFFPNVLIKYHAKGLGEIKKTPINYMQFLDEFNKSTTSTQLYNGNDSDFLVFVESFKKVKTSEFTKSKVKILLSDTSVIKIVKNYYNMLASENYREAFSNLINPTKTESEFIVYEKNIHDQIIKEINQIDSNTVEVFSDVQLQNTQPQSYREVYKVTNNKIEPILKDVISGKVSTFNNMRTYAANRESQSIVVLQNNGEEKIIDSHKNEEAPDFYSRFFSPFFSPKGRYLIYYIQYYEGGRTNVYDLFTNKLLNVNLANGNFNYNESLYFSCEFNEAFGPTEARIYSVPDFKIKEDLITVHPGLNNYWNYKCWNDEKNNIETFEFSNMMKPNNPDARVIYRFDSMTGEPISNDDNGSAVFGVTTMLDFVSCINEKATLYSTFWSPHTQEQKKFFSSSVESLNYIECSTSNGMSQTQTCKAKNIMSYPTWEFADGSRVVGKMSIEQLGLKTSCEIPN